MPVANVKFLIQCFSVDFAKVHSGSMRVEQFFIIIDPELETKGFG